MSPFAPLDIQYCYRAEFIPSHPKDYWPLKPSLQIDFSLRIFSYTIAVLTWQSSDWSMKGSLPIHSPQSKRLSRHFPANQTSLALSFYADTKKYFLPFPYNNPILELLAILQELHGALWAAEHQEATKQSEISGIEHTLPFNHVITWVSEVGNKGKEEKLDLDF